MPIQRKRVDVLALTSALVLTSLSVLPHLARPASAQTAQEEAADAAAEWISAEFDRPDSQFDLFRPGVLADIVFALSAAGSQGRTASDALAELAASADAYIGAPGSVDSGALGKVLLAVLVMNGDPTTFVAGRDLEAELRAAMTTDGADEGRFGEADVFKQALAILALSRTNDGVPAAAAEWLAGRQCADGDFTFLGTCPAAPGAEDPDTTAIAAQALLAGGSATGAEEAVQWLLDRQGTDGSISSFGAANANSTGVTAQAFRAAGEAAAADAAAGFVMSLQFGQGAPAADIGGIRFVATDVAANGFATLQGILAFGAPRYDELVAPQGVFDDVPNDHLFAGEIAWIAGEGITRGCNPPANDRFCPEDFVTRGQMAAFLVRGLPLSATSDVDFVDDDGSVFEEDIDKLATAGITKGCNPPVSDRFCPDDLVTRGEMAAFLVRGLDLADVGAIEFTDDDGSIFEDDIRKLAAAGITRGCNPPANDRFCPERSVTRGEMAAFLERALST